MVSVTCRVRQSKDNSGMRLVLKKHPKAKIYLGEELIRPILSKTSAKPLRWKNVGAGREVHISTASMLAGNSQQDTQVYTHK